MQARFYVPWYHRFASPDPALDQQFEDTQSWNIYSYCQNNPVTNVDPDGMAKVPDWLVRVYDKALDGAAAGLTYGKMVPGLGAGIMLGEAASMQRVDTSGNVHEMSGSESLKTGILGAGSLALQCVGAGAPATSTLILPGGLVPQASGIAALQQVAVVVPSGAAVAGVAGAAAPALAMTGGRGSSDSSKNEKHGDSGRAQTKAEKQIDKLKQDLKNAETRSEKRFIEQKIKNIERAAAKARKGVEHSLGVKR